MATRCRERLSARSRDDTRNGHSARRRADRCRVHALAWRRTSTSPIAAEHRLREGSTRWCGSAGQRHRVARVADDWHARFRAPGDAIATASSSFARRPHRSRQSVAHRRTARPRAMTEGAAKLMERTILRHSAGPLQSASGQSLDALTVERVGEEIHLSAAARSFLHHQVRRWSGAWRWSAAEVDAAISLCARSEGRADSE